MARDPGSPYTLAPDGVSVAIRLTPRGGRDGLAGLHADAEGRVALAVRVAAAPHEGAANAALVALLAKALRLPRSDVTILSGATARLKLVRLAGDGPAIAARLAAWIAAGP